MRLRRSGQLSSPEPTPPLAIEDVEVESETPIPWSVEQLHALGPITGPSHRTYVPIVRSTARDNSLGELAESALPPTQLSFISEQLESFKGRDSL